MSTGPENTHKNTSEHTENEPRPDTPSGPDLTQGVAISEVPAGGMLAGHVGEEAVVIARVGDNFFAIGATCSHYNGPLAEGLIVAETLRCPWHHARFDLRSG